MEQINDAETERGDAQIESHKTQIVPMKRYLSDPVEIQESHGQHENQDDERKPLKDIDGMGIFEIKYIFESSDGGREQQIQIGNDPNQR